MTRTRVLIGVAVVIVLAGLGYFGYSRVLVPSSPTPTPRPMSSASRSTVTIVSAEGIVVPVKQAQLAFKIGGRVAELLVEEGDQVAAGQVLARLETTDLEHAVRQGEAALKVAEARLAQARASARPEEIAAAEASLAAAKAGLVSAQANLTSAQANLARLLAGATERELEVARLGVDQARDTLWGAQAQRDAIGGRVDRELIFTEADYDEAKAQVQVAETGVRIAELQYEDLKAGAREEDIAMARAQVEQAQGQVAAAQAQVEQAQAQLDLLKAGARAEDIAVAQAGVEQAEAALAQARSALKDAVLAVPFAGTVAAVQIEEGEMVAAGRPALAIGDLSRLQVKTEDLSEVDVSQVRVGQEVEIAIDALPDHRFRGRVARIAPMAVERRGDTVYTVTIDLEEGIETGLRWGMTTFVDIRIVEE